MVAHGLGTSLYNGVFSHPNHKLIAGFGIVQFILRLTNPLFTYKIRNLKCLMHTEWDTAQGVQDELDLNDIQELEADVEYLNIAMSIGFWIWCLYTIIQSIKQLPDEPTRQKYQRFLYVLVIFAATDWVSSLVHVLWSFQAISFEYYIVDSQIAQCLYVMLLTTIAWMWWPTSTESDFYNALPVTEHSLYMAPPLAPPVATNSNTNGGTIAAQAAATGYLLSNNVDFSTPGMVQ